MFISYISNLRLSLLGKRPFINYEGMILAIFEPPYPHVRKIFQPNKMLLEKDQ